MNGQIFSAWLCSMRLAGGNMISAVDCNLQTPRPPFPRRHGPLFLPPSRGLFYCSAAPFFTPPPPLFCLPEHPSFYMSPLRRSFFSPLKFYVNCPVFTVNRPHFSSDCPYFSSDSLKFWTNLRELSPSPFSPFFPLFTIENRYFAYSNTLCPRRILPLRLRRFNPSSTHKKGATRPLLQRLPRPLNFILSLRPISRRFLPRRSF